MARVPTWTELRLDAIKLAKTQKECYRSVHILLDSALPKLDQKISKYIDVDFIVHDPIYVPQYHEVNPEPQRNVTPQVSHVPKIAKISSRQHLNSPQNELDIIENLEYLKPPPMPLSKYFERTRIFKYVQRRDMYQRKKKAERKKYLANKLINSLERIRLSSRNSTNTLNNNVLTNHNRFCQANQNHYMPDHRVKLSEQEMKRLTAKNFKRLPEVKKRRQEDARRYMKVQNYKNKLEFCSKLLENRRQGIIDYPLSSNVDPRSAYDNRSITSSQSDFLINGCARAADRLRSQPHY